MEQQTNEQLQEQHKEELQDLKDEVQEKEEKIQEMTVKFDSYLRDQEDQLVNIKEKFQNLEHIQRQTQRDLDLKTTSEKKLNSEIEYLREEKSNLQKKING